LAPGIGAPSENHCSALDVAAGLNEPPLAVSTAPTLATPLTAGTEATCIVPGAVGAVAAELL
jgi:hypothetical protein